MSRSKFAQILNSVIYSLLLLVAFATPLLFLPFTTEFFETPKLIFISAVVLAGILLWSLSWVVDGKITFTRTPLDIPLILLLIVIAISTYFSDSKLVSIFGNMPRIHGSMISWVVYILLYFLAASHIKTETQIKNLFYALLSSSLIMSVVTLFSYFGLYLPVPFAKVQNFSPAGSTFSALALLIMLLPLPLISLLNPNKFLPSGLAVSLASVFGLTIALTGTLTIQAVALIVLILTILQFKASQIRENLPALLVPVAISVLVLAASSVPLGKKANPLLDKKNSFPQEIQLSFPISWKVSASSFRDAPFIGTGPSTYLFNFTSYKPTEFNSNKFWNIRFDSAYNEYLQIFGTLGILGLLAFLLFSINVAGLGWLGLRQKNDIATLSLSLTSIAAILLLLTHVSTLVVVVGLLLLLAMLMASNKSVNNKVEELTIGIKTQRMTDSINPQSFVAGDILPIVVFIPLLIALAVVLWNGISYVRADYFHRTALNSAGIRGLDTYNNLVQAERLNPYIDLYRVDLAQTNFALANAIATSKGPTEASPTGSLTDQDKENIQTLLSQAIAEGRAAVTISPRSAANWEIVASIYRNISGVAQNALQFSLDAFGRAIKQDPLNPILRVNVGGVYYSNKNYDMAVRFFSDSINLKPDYANGWYNLSVALRDKGDLQAAVQAAEQVVSLLQKDTNSPDYKVASDYLAELKARIATGSAQESEVGAPAGATQGALQNNKLPKVLDLPKPDNIATPPAVKR